MNTTTVMFTVSQLRIVSARHFLSEAGIESWTVNKMDSAHAGLFGDMELHVPTEDEIEARRILVNEEIIISAPNSL